jgi:hypothetical protein
MLDSCQSLGDVGDLRLDDDAFFPQSLPSELDHVTNIVAAGIDDFRSSQSGIASTCNMPSP